MKVSVCVVTYNHRNYIEQCLDSIIAQETDFQFELIIGDDESSDGTREIIERYTLKHPDIMRPIYRLRKDVLYIDGRPTGRFNFIENLKQAKGEYIALCDGDDYWTDPKKLQEQVDYLDAQQDCVLSHHEQVKLMGDDKIKDERFKDLTEDRKDSADGLFSFRIQPQTRTMIFRNCLRTEDLDSDYLKYSIYGDFALCFLLAQYGKLGYMAKNMAVYRVHDQGYAARSLKSNMDYFNSRLKLVKMWCDAKRFLECDRTAFRTGILKLYTSGINRVGRKKSGFKIFIHWSKMRMNFLTYFDILIAISGKVLFPSKMDR